MEYKYVVAFNSRKVRVTMGFLTLRKAVSFVIRLSKEEQVTLGIWERSEYEILNLSYPIQIVIGDNKVKGA